MRSDYNELGEKELTNKVHVFFSNFLEIQKVSDKEIKVHLLIFKIYS